MTIAETLRLKRHTENQILTLLRELADTSGMSVDGVIVHARLHGARGSNVAHAEHRAHQRQVQGPDHGRKGVENDAQAT